MKSLHTELSSKPGFDSELLEDFEESSIAWYVMVRAAERFRSLNNRFANNLETDIEPLAEEAKKVLAEMEGGSQNISLDSKYVFEMVRYGESKLHNVSAFLGGIAS